MDEDITDKVQKRVIKLTPKALEEKLNKQMRARKCALTQLTSKTKDLESLMEDDSNAYIVERDHLSDYSTFLRDFIHWTFFLHPMNKY